MFAGNKSQRAKNCSCPACPDQIPKAFSLKSEFMSSFKKYFIPEQTFICYCYIGQDRNISSSCSFSYLVQIDKGICLFPVFVLGFCSHKQDIGITNQPSVM